MNTWKRAGAAICSLGLLCASLPACVQATEEQQVLQAPGATEMSTMNMEGYSLVWSDEFEGDSLNREDWNVELHEAGWVNEELQEYVDSTDNIQVSDGLLTIKPVRTVNEDGSVSYTSGRVSTQNKEDFTYGMFEVRAKVPEGMGYLPAFWLMATDEGTYGQWPRCGEIDCMEVMGQDTDLAYGTIHYGNPHREDQGTYTLTDGSTFSDSFHTFTCEWEPGVIRWYIDGNLYHETSDWYSTTEGQGTITYPAPFDQPFYIILNLAVGGSWVGYPDETTDFDNASYQIDYVRVYQKDSYDENVTKPVQSVTLRDPDASGNYIVNGTFSDTSHWTSLTALSGDANFYTKNNQMVIETIDDGTVDYSVQLVQADLPFEKGATYEVSFDAYASADRTMVTAVKAPDYGYAEYMPSTTVDLTTEKQTFTYQFRMTSASDANGRLEYNMGNAGSTATIYLSNVSVKKIKDADPNEKEVKTVLADGNYVYNGKFQEGDSHLGYWDIDTTAADASVSVTGLSDDRRAQIVGQGAAVTLSEDDLALGSGQAYELSFDASASEAQTLTVTLGGQTYQANLTAETTTYTFPVSKDTALTDHNIAFSFPGTGTAYLDNVTLSRVYSAEDNLLQNADFSDESDPMNHWSETIANWGGEYTASASRTTGDGAITYVIDNVGTDEWHIQLKQSGLSLSAGETYVVTMTLDSTCARTVKTGVMSTSYTWYGGSDAAVSVGENTIRFGFTMTVDDPAADFYVSLGKISGEDTPSGTITISDLTMVQLSKDEEGSSTDSDGDSDVDSGADSSLSDKTDNTEIEAENAPASPDMTLISDKEIPDVASQAPNTAPDPAGSLSQNPNTEEDSVVTEVPTVTSAPSLGDVVRHACLFVLGGLSLLVGTYAFSCKKAKRH